MSWRKRCAWAAVLGAHIMLPAAAMVPAVAPAGKQAAAPSSIKTEHRHLHEQLAKAMRSGGRTGAAAKEVERLLAPHFAKEEQYGTPPLAHLPDLAQGKLPANPADVIAMTDRLKRDMPVMLREHKEISAAVQALRKAALAERKPEAVAFADALSAHAREEEQILYPSAILVGEYLKLKR